MAYPICKVKNISGDELTLHGKVFAVNEIYILPDLDRINWANDDSVILNIVSDKIQIGDSDTWLVLYANQIAHLQKY